MPVPARPNPAADAPPAGAHLAAPPRQASQSPSTTQAALVTQTARATQDTPAPAAADPGLAEWWRRLLAFVIDSLVLTLVTGALWGRLLASFANRMSNALNPRAARTPGAHGAIGRVFGNTAGPYLIVLVATIVVAISYYWVLTGYWGTTIGKRALGTWVVSAADRTRISLPVSLLRAVIFVLGGEVVPVFFLVDNLWLVRDRRRQALHDKAARTLVVRNPPHRN